MLSHVYMFNYTDQQGFYPEKMQETFCIKRFGAGFEIIKITGRTSWVTTTAMESPSKGHKNKHFSQQT